MKENRSSKSSVILLLLLSLSLCLCAQVFGAGEEQAAPSGDILPSSTAILYPLAPPPGSTAFFFDDFAAGIGNWTTSGLWHLSSIADPCYGWYSFPNSAAYNSAAASCTFNVGTTWGTMAMIPTVTIPTYANSSCYLSFFSWEQTECGGAVNCSWDRRIVRISPDGGSSWSYLWDSYWGSFESTWYERRIDITSYRGLPLKFDFNFNSGDSIANAYGGWYVDDVAVYCGGSSISGVTATQGAWGRPGIPIPGVTMTITGAASGNTLTDATGNFSFLGMADATYTVAPTAPGWIFTPASRVVTVAGGNAVTGQNFVGTPSGAAYSISGTITTTPFAGALAGVTVTLSGAASATTTTDARGNYKFTGLSYGNYVVTPAMAGYVFTPSSRAVSIAGASAAGQDFLAALAPATYGIVGTILTSEGFPMSGVTVALGGAGSSTATTDRNGIYTFTGLSNGSYSVTPSMGGYTFTPATRAVAISGASVVGQDFTGNTPTYSISGTIRRPAGFGGAGAPLPGVTVTLSGAAAAFTSTDANGYYSFTGLFNGNYTVTPTLVGFAFTPPNRAVTISGANVPGQSFVGVGP